MKGVFRNIVLIVSFVSPMALAEAESIAIEKKEPLPPIVTEAIAYAVPAMAYRNSPMGKIDESSKALAKKFYVQYSHEVLKEKFEGRNPDQLLWTNYLKSVYVPLKDFVFAEIDALAGMSASKIKDPLTVKQRIEKRLQSWSVKAFYHYFNPPVEHSADSFSDKSAEITKQCSEAVAQLAANVSGSQLSDYYRQCYHPVSDLSGATLTPLIPTDALAAVLLSQARLAVKPEGIPPRLAQAVAWYAVLSDEALSHFEPVIEDKSDFQEIMMNLYRRGYSPETLAKIFRQNFVDFDLAYQKIWTNYEKHLSREWYKARNVKNFDR